MMVLIGVTALSTAASVYSLWRARKYATQAKESEDKAQHHAGEGERHAAQCAAHVVDAKRHAAGAKGCKEAAFKLAMAAGVHSTNAGKRAADARTLVSAAKCHARNAAQHAEVLEQIAATNLTRVVSLVRPPVVPPPVTPAPIEVDEEYEKRKARDAADCQRFYPAPLRRI